MMNSVKGKKKKELHLIASFVTVPPTKRFVLDSYAGLPALRSPACNKNGTHSSAVGPQCKDCHNLLKDLSGTQLPGSFVNKWYPTVAKAMERRQKTELTLMDRDDARSLMRVKDEYFTPEGIKLKEEAKAIVEYMDYVAALHSKLDTDKMKANVTGAVPGTDSFLGDIAEVYASNAKFRDSLEVALIKTLLTKLKTGRGNAKKEEKVVNFIRLLATHSPAAAEVASANLGGPSKRWMQELNARERSECIYASEYEDIVARVSTEIRQRAIDPSSSSSSPSRPSLPVSFTVAIDATKLAQVIELSAAYKAIMGSVYPNHCISISGKTKEDIESLMKGLEMASEVKAAIISFQNCPKGVVPMVVIAARPQSNNETSSFTRLIETACTAAATASGGRFLGFAVDGVSLESMDVRRSNCDFISGVSNHVGTTDPNHNAKSLRYQIIGGSCTGRVGFYAIDADFLRLAGVSMDLLRFADFASDLLVERLVSSASIRKLSVLAAEGEKDFSIGDVAVLAATLLMKRLHLHAVNGVAVPAAHRMYYLWTTMAWLTSIGGVCITTKRNLVSDTIPFMFLVSQSDVVKPRSASSEPAEHKFGAFRTTIREFTSAQFAQLVEKDQRRLRMMFRSNLLPSRDPRKGYCATFRQFIEYQMSSACSQGGPVLVAGGDGAAPVAEQCWPTVKEAIAKASRDANPLLTILGVDAADRSPFCKSFPALDELRDEYISYQPRTFAYGSATGSDANDNDVVDDVAEESHDGDKPAREMVERIRDVVSNLGSEFDDEEEDDDKKKLDLEDFVEPDDTSSSDDDATKLMTAVRAIFCATSAPELLERVQSASSILEPMSRSDGSESKVRKAKSLLARWICSNPSSADKDAESSDGLHVERGAVIEMNVKLGTGDDAPVTSCRYRVMGVYVKHYNKWLLTDKKQRWAKNLEEDKKKKYRFIARMINKDVSGLGECDDVALDGGDAYKAGDILRLENGTAILDITGKLQFGV